MPSDLELAAEIERLKERVAKLEKMLLPRTSGTLHVSDRSEMVPVVPNPPPAEPKEFEYR